MLGLILSFEKGGRESKIKHWFRYMQLAKPSYRTSSLKTTEYIVFLCLWIVAKLRCQADQVQALSL